MSDVHNDGLATYPNFSGKHAHEAFFGPNDFVSSMRRAGFIGTGPIPEGLIMCYQPSLFQHIVESEGADVTVNATVAGYRRIVFLSRTGGKVGVVGNFGIGAPAAGTVLEEFIALGVTNFISIGAAGGLQESTPVGHTVLCDRAIRDEGLSHHYLPPGKYAEASSKLTEVLREALALRDISHRTGTSWTIDALFRETAEEVRHYQAEGVLTVEMESAALFAVATHRNVNMASAFVVSDSFADLEWNPQFGSKAVHDGLIALYEASVSALQAASSTEDVSLSPSARPVCP